MLRNPGRRDECPGCGDRVLTVGYEEIAAIRA
jgi:hypothetical protein